MGLKVSESNPESTIERFSEQKPDTLQERSAFGGYGGYGLGGYGGLGGFGHGLYGGYGLGLGYGGYGGYGLGHHGGGFGHHWKRASGDQSDESTDRRRPPTPFLGGDKTSRERRSASPFLGGFHHGYGLHHGIGYTSVHHSHHFVPAFGYGYGR